MLGSKTSGSGDTMATRQLGNAVSEIQEMRSRLLGGHWEAARADAHLRLSVLRGLLKANDPELRRHVIVSAVAALQTWFRGTLVELVNRDEVFRERAAESINEKFSLKDALAWINGKTTTFGELVAHAAPCNSVTDLISWLTKILGFDLKSALASAVSPYERNSPTDVPKLVNDVEALVADVGEAFRLRHILAHEAAPLLPLEVKTCARLLDAITLWMQAVEAVIWVTAFKDVPLTTLEMNAHAWRQVQTARDTLAKHLRRALQKERESGSAQWLRNNHRAWHQVVKDWRVATYCRLDGTMWPSVGAYDLSKAIAARAEQIADWLVSTNPELADL
jgi:hypothetical protein